MRESNATDNDVQTVSEIAAVPSILEVVCKTTGMLELAAVARVTPDRWLACSILDRIDFGLKPGGELDRDNDLPRSVKAASPSSSKTSRRKRIGVITQSRQIQFPNYISVPIGLADGSFFGTLCAIDPNPRELTMPDHRHVSAFRRAHCHPSRCREENSCHGRQPASL